MLVYAAKAGVAYVRVRELEVRRHRRVVGNVDLGLADPDAVAQRADAGGEEDVVDGHPRHVLSRRTERPAEHAVLPAHGIAVVRAVRRTLRRVRRVAVAGKAEHLVRERAGAAVQVTAADHRQLAPLPADRRHAVQDVARVQLADRIALQSVALPPEVRRERDEPPPAFAVLEHGPRHALLGLEREVEEVESRVEQLEARLPVEQRLVVHPVRRTVSVGRARAAQRLLLVAAHDTELNGEVFE